MRALLAVAVLTLAGCNTTPPAGNADQPNEAVVEAELENEQTAQTDAIVNEAPADNGISLNTTPEIED